MNFEQLCGLAVESMSKAYAPYSGVKVGAALLTADGRTYTGCNIENSSFSPTLCAERVAFAKAVSEGERSFSAIAVCGGKNGIISAEFPPCGVCRQLMSEFCTPEFKILLVRPNGFGEYTLGELLPCSFSADKLS